MMKKIEPLFWSAILMIVGIGLMVSVFMHQLRVIEGWLQ